MAGWKMDGENITMQDGHPVWDYGDGNVSPLDVGSTLATLKNTTAESVSRKNKIKDLESKIAPFTAIENPLEFIKNANTAIETVKNFDDKKLVDADQVDLIKKSVADTYDQKISGITTAYEAKEKDYLDKLNKSESAISNLLKKGDISRSKFITDKTVLTPSIAYDVFKNNFTIEDVGGDAKAIGIRKDGTKIMSLKDPGNFATVDEALETLIMEHPDKDRLLKGIDGGGGAPPNGHSNFSGKTISRQQFESMNASQKRDVASKASKGEIVISD